MDVLFLCTGNICRSPLAEALLRYRLDRLGVPVSVSSAGLLDGDRPPPPDAVAAAAGMGLDTEAHRSRRLTAELIGQADLVIGMAREHVREAVALVPDAWPRTFTLKELVRRGEAVGERSADQPIAEWLEKVHAGRSRTALLGRDASDDVADPIGGSRRAYDRMAAELDDLVERLVALAWRCDRA